MRIIREFRIVEVRATMSMNAPLILTLDAGVHDLEDSKLTLDQDACKYFKINPNLNRLMGKKLELTLTSVEMELTESFYQPSFPFEALKDHDLMIAEISMHQGKVFSYSQCPPSKYSTVRRTLTLETHDTGGRFSMVPCPFYQLELPLTESEYEECRDLAPSTIFRLSIKPL